MRHMIQSTMIALLTVFAAGAYADWKLVSDASTLSFSSVKNGMIVEPHMFSKLTGEVAANGAARVDIELGSVDTMIPIRDERMREFLFETVSFPKASFSATIPVSEFETMEIGAAQPFSLKGSLDLHGKAVNKIVNVTVSRSGEDSFVVSTVRPMVVTAAEFDLVSGLGKLQELAGLQSISPMVPVSFSLLFEK